MTGRLALVLGGSGGIGRACVLELAARGCHVVAVGRDEAALLEVVALARSSGGSGEAHVCNATDESQVNRLFGTYGAAEIVVHSVGVSSSAPIRRASLDDVRAMFETNAVSAFLATRAAIPILREHAWGRLVYVASTCGIVGLPYTGAYSMSKHAVIGLMRVTAAELASTGVTANAVCPSYVRTKMSERTIETIVKSTARSPEEASRALTAKSALQRLLEPEEVAAAVGYLCSDAAGGVSGQVLVIDGGDVQH
jgi:NAD(P)-dependent dehydrogenase (short-subunit alcohol dehydrogenase family)